MLPENREIQRNIETAVITGPTGAVGTALARLLAEKGVKVLAVVRPGSPRADHLKDVGGVELIPCDLSELSRLPEIVPSADAFFHLAWAGTTGAGRNDFDVQIKNIQYTLDAVRAAKALNCKVFVGAGSQAEYGRHDCALRPDTPCFPENGYGMAKLCAGMMSRAECRKLGIDCVWPRILSVYGPFDGEGSLVSTLLRKLRNGEKVPLTEGAQVWDYLYSGDAAEALLELARYGKDGGVYPLGSGKAMLLREFVEIIRDETAPGLPLGFGEIPYGDKQVMHLEADISALSEDTGFVPKVSFREGIRRTLASLKLFV